MGIFDLSATAPNGGTLPLRDFEGKVLLIVNTASKCGFTPQFTGLEELWQDYRDQGLVVLGFPCNQFGNQELGNDDEIQEFCQVNYGVTFPMMAKVDVNGSHADPIFTWLTSEQPGFLGIKSIKWNFTKFLVDREGAVIARFRPTDEPASLRDAIEVALKTSQ